MLEAVLRIRIRIRMDPHQSQKQDQDPDPDLHQDHAISGAVETQSSAMWAVDAHNGGVEAQNGVVEGL
jgi:hypothetical protein